MTTKLRAAPSDDVQFERAPLEEVRRLIARAMLDAEPGPERFGSITLHPHQASAARRIEALLDREGGALLSDAVGLGKTYAALAVAASRGPLLVIAPAGLRRMWLDAFQRTGVRGELVSFESLSRGRRTGELHRLVIVDEAHHARNPKTRRYDGVARACARAGVVLLSATPLHTSRADVAALLALFLGSRAYELTDEEVARFIVRRTAVTDAPAVPTVTATPPRVIIRDEALLDGILALPSPIPPREGAIAPRLLAIGLVRQWVSSTAALAAALRRRVARGEALLAALDAGRYPDASDLRAWTQTDDTLQLAFPELLPRGEGALPELASLVRAHVAAVRALRSRLTDDGADAMRTAFVRDIRRTHSGEKMVAFTAYAETAHALYRAMRHDGQVALLTAHGGVVAGGPLTRDEVLFRFAPVASGSMRPRAAEDISLLIATDLLSEGVNLQDASILVHLDLPWTPARLAQRAGRIARLGAAHDVVTSYTIEPPPRASAWLRSQEILARKAAASDRMLGANDPVAHASHAAIVGDDVRSPVASMERILEMLRAVPRDVPRAGARLRARTVIAGVCAPAPLSGALVVTRSSSRPLLLAVAPDGTVSSASAVVEPFVAAALGRPDALPSDVRAREILAAVRRWSERRRAASAAGVAECAPERGNATGARRASRARQEMIRHASSLGASTPFARRAALAALAERIRHAAAHAIPIAIERDMRELSLSSVGSGHAARLATLIERLDERSRRTTPGAEGIEILAAILFVPDA